MMTLYQAIVSYLKDENTGSLRRYMCIYPTVLHAGQTDGVTIVGCGQAVGPQSHSTMRKTAPQTQVATNQTPPCPDPPLPWHQMLSGYILSDTTL